MNNPFKKKAPDEGTVKPAPDAVGKKSLLGALNFKSMSQLLKKKAPGGNESTDSPETGIVDKKALLKEKLWNFLFPKPEVESVIGVDLNHSRLFALELNPKSSKLTLANFAVSHALDEKKPVGEQIAEFIEKEKFTASKINISMSGSVVMVRFLEFAKMKLEDLRVAMRFEVEKYIPFKADQVLTDYHIIGDSFKDKKMMRVILVAAKKQPVMQLITAIYKANLKIKNISVHSLSCLNAFESAYAQEIADTTLLFDIGIETSSLIVLLDKELAFVRDISIGSRELFANFKKKINWVEEEGKVFSLEESLPGQEALFEEVLDPFAGQLKVSLSYFLNQNPQAKMPQKLYLSGECVDLPLVHQGLSKAMEMESVLVDAFKGVDLGPVGDEKLNKYRSMLNSCMGLSLLN